MKCYIVEKRMYFAVFEVAKLLSRFFFKVDYGMKEFGMTLLKMAHDNAVLKEKCCVLTGHGRDMKS